MKKIAYISLLCILLLVVAALYGYGQPARIFTDNKKLSKPDTKVLIPVEKPDSLKKENGNVLNLALPENTMLMDPVITLPDSQHKLGNLFTREAKEPTVMFGGQLILDEKPLAPNAAVWDAVKGAEVGITIKTP